MALEKGFANLKVHIENMSKFGVPVAVALNKFISDTDAEISLVKKLCAENNADCVLCEGREKGGDGAKELAEAVVKLTEKKSEFKNVYPLDAPIEQKITMLAKEIYRASSVEFDGKAKKKIKALEAAGFGNLPICMAKTQNSITHDKSLIGAPKEAYAFPVRDVQLYSGAGFIVAFAGDIVDMPGLPSLPAAMNIDVDDNGVISGLF